MSNAFVAIGTAAAVWWWIGLAILVLVIIPAVLFVALTLIRTIAEIGRYAADIRTHGAGLADAVARSGSLEATPGLAAGLGEQLQRYARANQHSGGAP